MQVKRSEGFPIMIGIIGAIIALIVYGAGNGVAGLIIFGISVVIAIIVSIYSKSGERPIRTPSTRSGTPHVPPPELAEDDDDGEHEEPSKGAEQKNEPTRHELRSDQEIRLRDLENEKKHWEGELSKWTGVELRSDQEIWVERIKNKIKYYAGEISKLTGGKENIAESRTANSIQSKIDSLIQDALKVVDSVGRDFNNEDEANTQLCQVLIASSQGAYKIDPKPQLGDITIEDTIIEGKLDLLHQNELDRLFGELVRYCDRTKCQVRVVIYGRIRPDLRDDIDKFLDKHYSSEERYRSRVSLIYLQSPRRFRRDSQE